MLGRLLGFGFLLEGLEVGERSKSFIRFFLEKSGGGETNELGGDRF